jgi:hypothetical protein
MLKMPEWPGQGELRVSGLEIVISTFFQADCNGEKIGLWLQGSRRQETEGEVLVFTISSSSRTGIART